MTYQKLIISELSQLSSLSLVFIERLAFMADHFLDTVRVLEKVKKPPYDGLQWKIQNIVQSYILMSYRQIMGGNEATECISWKRVKVYFNPQAFESTIIEWALSYTVQLGWFKERTLEFSDFELLHGWIIAQVDQGIAHMDESNNLENSSIQKRANGSIGTTSSQRPWIDPFNDLVRGIQFDWLQVISMVVSSIYATAVGSLPIQGSRKVI